MVESVVEKSQWGRRILELKFKNKQTEIGDSPDREVLKIEKL